MGDVTSSVLGSTRHAETFLLPAPCHRGQGVGGMSIPILWLVLLSWDTSKVLA